MATHPTLPSHEAAIRGAWLMGTGERSAGGHRGPEPTYAAESGRCPGAVQVRVPSCKRSVIARSGSDTMVTPPAHEVSSSAQSRGVQPSQSDGEAKSNTKSRIPGWLVWGTRGPRFESALPDHCAEVVQRGGIT